MKELIEDLKFSLEKLDHYRDELLFLFIKPYWPRRITPNQITYVRILVGLLLFALLFFFGIENKILILSLFCLGAVTDMVDGSVARGLDKVTEFGTMIDPIADRVLIFPIAFYSLYKSERWLLLFLILVEIIGALISILQKSKEMPIGANIFGKTKMVLLSLVFIAILIVWPNSPSVFFIDIIWLSLLFSLLSVFTKVLELNRRGYIKNKTINKHLNKLD